MQRDLDFVREILLAVAGSNGPLDGRALVSDGHGLGDVAYHVKIMIEGGLLEGRVQYSGNYVPLNVQVDSMTWAGNDFLDTIRDDGVWKAVKLKVAQAVGTVSFEVLKGVAVSCVTARLGM